MLTTRAKEDLEVDAMPYSPTGNAKVGNKAGLGGGLCGDCIKSDWRTCLENMSAGQITIHDDSQLVSRIWNGRVGCRLSTVQLVLNQTSTMCGVPF